MFSKFILLFFSLCFSAPSLLAQSSAARNTKWGKATDEEWQITRCEYDTTASAIVLFDKGEMSFFFDEGIITKRYVRIKILSLQGIDEANIHLPFYSKDQIEKIKKLDAQTINRDALGKEVIHEVATKQIFEIKENENWSEKRFSFPEVKVGSIIEYKYTTISRPYTYIEGWKFQTHIPTLYSEFKAALPESMVFMQGVRLIQRYNKKTTFWSLENLPAIKPERFVYHYLDYVEKINFLLTGHIYKNELPTWEDLSKKLLNSEIFTSYLGQQETAKEIIKSEIKGSESDLEKIKKLYAYVQTHIHWNRTYSFFTKRSLSQVIERTEANSGEINLFLVLLLQEAGLEADPVLISTKNNGVICRDYPFLTQFIHTLANVRLQDKDILLDAIDPLRPYDQLAEYDLETDGYLMSKTAPRWISIPAALDSKQTTFIEADLYNPEKPLYKVDLRYTGYYALEKRRKYEEKDKKSFENLLSKLSPTDYQLIDLKVVDADSIDKPLVINYVLRPDETSHPNNILYLNPIVVNHFTENPFKNETRNLPIELGYLSSHSFTIAIKIPAGYEVQELPANFRLEMPKKMAEFSYMTIHVNHIIQIRTIIKFKTILIPSEYYLDLREFYSHIIAKYQEQLVLKKK